MTSGSLIATASCALTHSNGPAQRAMIAAIHALEQQLATEAAAQQEAAIEQMSYTDAARRIILILKLAYQEQGKPMPDGFAETIAGLTGPDEAKTGA